jgi:hypothetical protein
MAKRKRSTPPAEQFSPIPTANIPRDPETLAKLGRGVLDIFAESETKMAEEAAKRAIAAAGKRPKRRTTQHDIQVVNSRLGHVALNLMAIYEATVIAMDNKQDADTILTLIRESARSSARAIDAAVQRLDAGRPQIGCYADDLSND